MIFSCVGFGMASPYLLIGLFPGWRGALPKPGPWMETFKQVMGFVMLGTVVYLFATIGPTIHAAFPDDGPWFACWVIGRVPVYAEVGKQRSLGHAASRPRLVGFCLHLLVPGRKELSVGAISTRPRSPNCRRKGKPLWSTSRPTGAPHASSIRDSRSTPEVFNRRG